MRFLFAPTPGWWVIAGPIMAIMIWPTALAGATSNMQSDFAGMDMALWAIAVMAMLSLLIFSFSKIRPWLGKLEFIMGDDKPGHAAGKHKEFSQVKGFSESKASGIGTGVIKLFQQIKNNIGEEKTLAMGYCHLLGLACEHFGFDAGAAFLLDHRGNYSLNGYHNLNFDQQEKHTLDKTGLIVDLLTKDIPKFITDLSEIPESCQTLFADYKAAWLVPLVPQGVPAGILIFVHKELPQNCEEYYPKLDFVSIAAGWFFEDNRKERLIDKENKKNLMLVNTSLAISSSLDLNEVCTVLVSNLGRAFECSFSYIMLGNENSGEMRIQTHFSGRGGVIFGPEKRNVDIRSMTWLSEIITMGNPVLLESYEIGRLPETDKEILKIDSSVKTLIAPLKHADKLTGVLFMVEQRSAERTRLDDEVVDLCAALVAQAAAAIENSRLYAMVSDRVAQITTMFDVGQALNTDLDLVPFFERVLNAIAKNFKISTCSFFLRDFDKDELYLVSQIGNFPERNLSKRLKIGKEGITGHAAALGKAINVGDVTQDHRFVESTGHTGSELAVPVILHGKVVGILDIESNTKYAFSQREEDLLKSLVDQIAVAVEKIKLKQLEKERSSKLALTNFMAKRLSGERDQGQFLEEAVKGLTEGFGFDLAAIFLPEKDGSLRLARQSCRWGDGFEPGLIMRPDQGLPGIVAAQKAASHIDQFDPVDQSVGLKDIKSRFCLPLLAGNALLGVLDIQDRRSAAFSAIDISTLQTFGEFLAVALNNIKLYGETISKADRLSLVDQINQAVSTTLDLEELFGRIVRSLSEITGYQWAALFLKGDTGYYVRSSYARGYNYDQAQMQSPDPQELAKQFDEVFGGGPPLYSNADDFKSSIRLYKFFKDEGINYIAFCPIKQRGLVRGVLVIGSPNPDGFSQHDRILLHDVSMHLEIALNNATLYGEIKDAYNRLHETQEKLIQSEKFKALGEVAAGIAHDFKNILAAVTGRAQLLMMRIQKEETVSKEVLLKGLEIIDKSAGDGVNILSRINEFSHTRKGSHYLKIDLKEIINDTIEMTRTKWENPNEDKNISVTFTHEGGLSIIGDRSEMVEVFSNLIINAADAIAGKGKIDIKTKAADDAIFIDVSDNGTGMDSQLVKRIFDPFFTTKGRKGTGLGLTMVYAIIQRHGGEIAVDSKPGQGTTFKIRLPAWNRFDNEQSLNILIAEGDTGLRETLSAVLANMGINAIWTDGFTEIPSLMAENHIDMILIDSMPQGEMDYQIIKRIKDMSPEIPLVSISGKDKTNLPEVLTFEGISEATNKLFDMGKIGPILQKIRSEKIDVGNAK
jgi:signal transduction histidine kinase/CheY-like chemotaxis protein